MPITTTTYGFIPTSISNCALWLDGADPAGNGVVPPAGNLATWVDKSSSANNALAGTAVYPQYNTAFLNNLGVVGLTNAADYFTVANNLNSASLTYVFVMQPTTANTGNKCGILSTDTAGLYGRSVALNNMIFEIEVYNGFTATSITTNATTWYIVSVVFNGTSSVTFSYNGNISTYGGSGTGTNSSGLTIGSYNSSSSYTTFNANFYLAEAIVYTSALLQTQYQQVEAYLAQKWGLTSSLSAGHPGLTTTVYQSSYLKTAGPKRNIATMKPFYTAFSPRQIAGCSLWLDAADSSTITGTSPVTQWRDKSVNNYTMTYTGSPTYRKTSALNNLGCITFNGTTSFNSGTDTMYWSGFSISQPFTVFVVCTKRLSSNTAFSFVLEPSTSSGSVILYGGLQLKMYAGSADQYTNPILAFVANSTIIYSAVFNGASSLLAYSGNATSSLNPGTASWPNLYLGRDWSGVYDSGDYGEILFYNSALSTTQRQQVESYLAQKWGLTSSLPGAHLNATQPAGAVTSLSLANSKMTLTKSVALAVPQTVAGLALWLDATKITGFANGATLTSWTDSIGNRSFSNVNTVTYQTSIMNGLPAVYMNGPGPYLEYSGTPPALVSGGTIYGVVQNNADGLVQPNYSGATFQVLWQMNGYTNGWEGYPYNFNNTSVLGSLATSRRTWGYPFSSSYFKSPHIVKVVSTTDSWIQSFIQTATSTNASYTDTSASTPTLSAPMRLGACMDGPGLGYYKGYFAEVLIFNRGLNSTEQTTIENYLKAKWNV